MGNDRYAIELHAPRGVSANAAMCVRPTPASATSRMRGSARRPQNADAAGTARCATATSAAQNITSIGSERSAIVRATREATIAPRVIDRTFMSLHRNHELSGVALRSHAHQAHRSLDTAFGRRPSEVRRELQDDLAVRGPAQPERQI